MISDFWLGFITAFPCAIAFLGFLALVMESGMKRPEKPRVMGDSWKSLT